MTNPDEQQKPLEMEEVKLHLDRLDKDVKEIAKQFKSIQISLNAIYEDRDLLTDIANDIEKVRSLVIASDRTNQVMTKGVEEKVEKTAEQVKAEVHEQTHEVKSTVVQKVLTGIQKNFSKEDATLTKRPWYKRLLFWQKGITVAV